jgi:hypothetical protein
VPLRLTLEADYEAMLTACARRDRLDEAIAQLAGDSEFTPVVRRLSCLVANDTLVRPSRPGPHLPPEAAERCALTHAP